METTTLSLIHAPSIGKNYYITIPNWDWDVIIFLLGFSITILFSYIIIPITDIINTITLYKRPKTKNINNICILPIDDDLL